MPQIIVNQNEYVAHSRTKGSKNGVRRYQNPDGTLTEEGKLHYGRMYGWGEGAKDYGNIAKEAKNVGYNAINEPNKMYKNWKKDQSKAYYKEQVKSISDQDLAKIIKRLENEKKYVNAMTPEVKSGMDRAMDVLEIVGGAASTAVAVGTVASMIAAHKISKDAEIRKSRGQ